MLLQINSVLGMHALMGETNAHGGGRIADQAGDETTGRSEMEDWADACQQCGDVRETHSSVSSVRTETAHRACIQVEDTPPYYPPASQI